MAGAIAAALKKAALWIGTDKKTLKTVAGIVLGMIVLLVMPIAAVLGIFSGDVKIDTERLQELLEQQQGMALTIVSEIEERMQDEGYCEQRIEEAQTFYMLVLFNRGGEDGFVEKYVGCFEIEQTDEELIAAVNGEFGTSVTAKEYADAMQEIRDKYAEKEKPEEHKICSARIF